MSLHYCLTAGLKYIDQDAHTRSIGLASRIIDVIHCSPLSTVAPWTTPANRGADGETLVTPSGRGLAKTQSQRERSMKRDRPPTNNSSSDWIIHCSVQLLVIFLSQRSWPLLLKGVSVVCGLKRAARRKLKIADLCLANKEQQPTAGCQLGYATHSDSSASSMERRSFTETEFEAFGWIWCKISARFGV